MDNKKRLIDADALQKRICGAKCGCEYEDCGSEGDCEFDFFIFHAPTVDAVEVVRCKDCKFIRQMVDAFTHEVCGYWCGARDWEEVELDDFCSYGERSESK